MIPHDGHFFNGHKVKKFYPVETLVSLGIPEAHLAALLRSICAFLLWFLVAPPYAYEVS